MYPLPTITMEGDTPSFLGLIQNGLNNMEHPDWGSWGGRYRFYIPRKAPIFAKKEKYPIWTNAEDTIYFENGTSETSNFATIWRWREAYQFDFLARLKWTETGDYKNANHAPVVKLDTPSEFNVKCGEKVILSVKDTIDPDGDKMYFHWFNYKEAGDYDKTIIIEGGDKAETSFIAPKESCTLHFIAEVKDNGTPVMRSYARVIVHVVTNLIDK